MVVRSIGLFGHFVFTEIMASNNYEGKVGGSFLRVHSQIINAVRKARNPRHPTTIPPAVKINVIDMSADSFSGDATPDDPRALKLRIIPITVPSNPTAGPQSVSAPPEIIVHFKAGFIFSLPNVRDDLPPLAFGTKGCSAADVPKVPKAWWLGPSPRSAYFIRYSPVMGKSLSRSSS
jgi:hypothetical protein